jgi:hypothetical protein
MTTNPLHSFLPLSCPPSLLSNPSRSPSPHQWYKSQQGMPKCSPSPPTEKFWVGAETPIANWVQMKLRPRAHLFFCIFRRKKNPWKKLSRAVTTP